MTVLSTQLIGLQAAATAVGSKKLVMFLADAYRHLSEIAVKYRGKVLETTGPDLIVIWDDGEFNSSAREACLAAWSLQQRFRELRRDLIRRYGIEISPRTSVVSDYPGMRILDDNFNHQRQIETTKWAQLLQRATWLFDTAILVDGTTARRAEDVLEFCEVDCLTVGDKGLLQQNDAIARTGLDRSYLPEIHGKSISVNELLGPRGKVAAGPMGSAMAFRGALELYRVGEYSKAASVLTLLLAGPSRGSLAKIYLDNCHQNEPKGHLEQHLVNEDQRTG